jgi:uncharacterized protein (TIGR02145 family)
MKRLLFSVCAVLAVFGCGGDTGDLPPFPGPDERGDSGGGSGYCRYYGNCSYMSVDACYNYGGTNYGNDSNCGGGGYVYSSSSSYRSSSSSVPSSGGYTGSYGSLSYGGQTYKTVVIGSQRWMAENLNYNPGTGNSACYSNQSSNCSTYGRLYDWATANTVCPSGWHLPSNDDWDRLFRYVDNVSGSGLYDSPTAGRYLKATSGWYNNGNGTDQYGFSALPGGGGNSDGSFNNVGDDGNWWGASENYSDNAYNRNMHYGYEDALWGSSIKSYLFSVRCLQD